MSCVTIETSLLGSNQDCLNLYSICFLITKLNPSFTKSFGTHCLILRGEGGGRTPIAISKTVAPINLTFCRVLETCFNVSEMLKLVMWCLLGYHSNSSKERCFIEKITRFQLKISTFKLLPNS